MLYDQITDALATEMPHGRFMHTLGVVQTAVALASRHDGNGEKVILAALLHDAVKHRSPEELLATADEGGIAIDAEERKFPAILHAPAAAAFARMRFGITDPEVLDAVRYHPTGCGNISRTMEILMAADYCEPTRDFPGVDEARQEVRFDLRNGLLRIVKRKVDHLRACGKTCHSRVFDTIAALEC